MSGWGALAGGITATNDFLMNLFNAGAAKRAQIRENVYENQRLQQQYLYDKEAQDRQNSYNWKMWNANNEYNTPAMQMQRYKEAGLNPNLVGGYAPYTPNPIKQDNPVAQQAPKNVMSGVRQAMLNQLQKIPDSLTKGQAAYYKAIEKKQNDLKLELAQRNTEIAEAKLQDLLATSDVKRKGYQLDNTFKENTAKDREQFEKNKVTLQDWQIKKQPDELLKLKKQIDDLNISTKQKQWIYDNINELNKKLLNARIKGQDLLNEKQEIFNLDYPELLRLQREDLSSRIGLTNINTQFKTDIMNEYNSLKNYRKQMREQELLKITRYNQLMILNAAMGGLKAIF